MKIDWGAVVFAVIALGLLVLVVKAIRRMREKSRGSSRSDDAEDKKKKPARPAATGDVQLRRDERVREQKARHAAKARAKALARGELDEDEAAEAAAEAEAEAEAAAEAARQAREANKSSASSSSRGSSSSSKKKGKKKKAPKKGAKRRTSGASASDATRASDAADDDDGAKGDAADSEAGDAGERGTAAVVDADEEQRRLSSGLAKTRGGFMARLGKLFKGKQIDEALLDEIEEVLFTADIGVRTAQSMIDRLRKELSKKQLGKADKVWAKLREHSEEILEAQRRDALDFVGAPFVLLVVGVNGAGKTTTIGKLAARLKAQGRSLLLAAGDTFRAAAVQQLEVWAERAEVPIISGKEGADPASVIVNAVKRAKEEGIDVVIADTAGRLQTKKGLMEELQKIHRAIAKHVDGAPQETLLVVDATTGQNAISQAKLFREAVDVSGIVLTKLDGTAKGGVVLGISHELELPVRYVGIGEGVDDLRDFEPSAFVGALFEDAA